MGRVIAASTLNKSSRQPSSQNSNSKPKTGKGRSSASDSVGVVDDDIMSTTNNSEIYRNDAPRGGQNPQTQEEIPQEEVIREPKKYCCSSSPQTECKIWGIVDIVLACLIFLILVNFTVTLKTNNEFLQAIIDRDKENERDLKRFLDYSPLKQDLVLTVAIGREIFSIVLGALLYVAAKGKIHHQLRIWLGTTFVVIVIDLFLFIPKVAFTQNKFIYVSSMIGYFLYKWYEVWMATLLFKEIRQESAAQSQLVGETNQQFEIESDRGYNDTPPGMRMGTGTMGKQIGGQMGGMGGHNTRPYGNNPMGNDSGGEEISGHYEQNMGNFVLAQPPKRISFHSRPEIMTRVESKSPVHIEQLQSYRY